MTQKLSLKEIAAIYKKSAKTFRKYVKEYKIPHAPLGRSMMFDLRRVELHLESLGFGAVAKPERARSMRSFPAITKYKERLGL